MAEPYDIDTPMICVVVEFRGTTERGAAQDEKWPLKWPRPRNGR
jgi:hypothetical protein